MSTATAVGMANSRWLICGSRGIATVATAADGEECGSPPGEDVGAEEGDAEDEAAGQEGEPADLDEGGQRADVAGRGAAGRPRRGRR